MRAAWRELEEARGRFTLRAQPDQGQLFLPFFEYAQNSPTASLSTATTRAFVRKTLQGHYLR